VCDTVCMQLPLFAICVAKEHETEIFEIGTLITTSVSALSLSLSLINPAFLL